MISKDIIVGKTFKSKNSGDFVIVEYNGIYSVTVRFTDTGYTSIFRAEHIRNGAVKDKLCPTIRGVGYLGVGEYRCRVDGKLTRAYSIFHNMIERCYNEDNEYYHRYGGRGVTISGELHNFQVFAKWYHDECDSLGINPESNNMEVDKDKTAREKAIYSLRTISLLTKQENVEEAHAKYFSFISPNGDTVKVFNLSKFCRENDLSSKSMNDLHLGGRRSSKGWLKAN